MPDELTHDVAALAARRWLHLPWQRPAIMECGLPDGTRADVLGLNLRTGRVHIIEVKVNRQDFVRGQKKFETYQQWSDLFYVAAPKDLVVAHELPKGVGLLTIESSNIYNNWHSTRVTKVARTDLMDDERRHQIERRVMGWLLSFYESRIGDDRMKTPQWPRQEWTP